MSSNQPYITFSLRSVLILLLIQVLVIMVLVWPRESTAGLAAATAPETPTRQPYLMAEPAPAQVQPTPILPDIVAPTAVVTAQIPEGITSPLSEGWLILSMNDGGYAHLFAYQPQTLPLTRLTNSPWDDLHPSVSPDGTHVAFTSRQNGYWDLFLLDLKTGQQTRMTDTPEWDGSPSWSPDSSWLVYESYTDDNLELWIRSALDPNLPPIRLTEDPSADRAPAWSPQGRHIAFVSNRSGENEIWLADLDIVDNRFSRLAARPSSSEDHPRWSAGGSQLLFASRQAGLASIFAWDPIQKTSPRRLGSGTLAVWSPSTALLASQVEEPNRSFLTAFVPAADTLLMPPVPLPSALHGLDWTSAPLPDLLAPPFATAAQGEARSLFNPQAAPLGDEPSSRYNVVEIPGLPIPYPYLHDRVDEAFNALRSRLMQETGWDPLSHLENAYLPLTAPLFPGMAEDWLYTGRAVALDSNALTSGWLAVVREDFNGSTYWRVYLKARFQDGSQGAPIPAPIWDLAARGTGDTTIYDQGGHVSPQIPAGYWIDLTDMAARYGWERQPALVNWRTYFPGAHFNELVITEGLDLDTALSQLYPREAFYTPTPVRTPTRTPTPIPTWYRTRQPTETTTPTMIPTRRPTWTPLP